MDMKPKNNKKANSEKFALSKLTPKNRAQISFNPGSSKGSEDKPSSDLNAIQQLSQEPNNAGNSGEGSQRQISERVLTITQRRHRSNVMRRMAKKFARLRQMKRLRMAPEARLKFRAQQLARSILRRRLAGERGKNYAKLSPSDKMAVDKIIDSRVKLVKKIAVRLLPVVRKAELVRLKAARSGTKATPQHGAQGAGLVREEHDDIITEQISFAILEGKADSLDGLMRAGLADKSSLSIYKKAVDNPEQAEKYSVYRKKIFSLFDKLVKVVLKNPAVYFKVKNDIQRDYQKDSVKEEVLDEAVKKKPRGRPPSKKTFSNQKLAYMARQGDKEAAKILADRKREAAATFKTNKATTLLKDIAAGKAKLSAKELALLSKSLKGVHKDKIIRALSKGADEVARKETSSKIKKQKVLKKASDEYSSMADAMKTMPKQPVKTFVAPTTTNLPEPKTPAPTRAAKKTRTAKSKKKVAAVAPPRPEPAKPLAALFTPEVQSPVTTVPQNTGGKKKFVVNVNPLLKQRRGFFFARMMKDRGDKSMHVSKFLDKLEMIHNQQEDPLFKKHIANAAETIAHHWKGDRLDQAYVLARNVHRNLKKLGVHESFLPKGKFISEEAKVSPTVKNPGKHPSQKWPKPKPAKPKEETKPVPRRTSPKKKKTPVASRQEKGKPQITRRHNEVVTQHPDGSKTKKTTTYSWRPGETHAEPGKIRHPVNREIKNNTVRKEGRQGNTVRKPR